MLLLFQIFFYCGRKKRKLILRIIEVVIWGKQHSRYLDPLYILSGILNKTFIWLIFESTLVSSLLQNTVKLSPDEETGPENSYD